MLQIESDPRPNSPSTPRCIYIPYLTDINPQDLIVCCPTTDIAMYYLLPNCTKLYNETSFLLGSPTTFLYIYKRSLFLKVFLPLEGEGRVTRSNRRVRGPCMYNGNGERLAFTK